MSPTTVELLRATLTVVHLETKMGSFGKNCFIGSAAVLRSRRRAERAGTLPDAGAEAARAGSKHRSIWRSSLVSYRRILSRTLSEGKRAAARRESSSCSSSSAHIHFSCFKTPIRRSRKARVSAFVSARDVASVRTGCGFASVPEGFEIPHEAVGFVVEAGGELLNRRPR